MLSTMRRSRCAPLPMPATSRVISRQSACHGPVGTAIRTREPAVFRDVTHDPDFAPWRAEALRRGYASVVGIPLLSGSEVLGALAIYAADPDAFDEDEMQLLRELADDLSYGIDALRTQAACQRAEE